MVVKGFPIKKMCLRWAPWISMLKTVNWTPCIPFADFSKVAILPTICTYKGNRASVLFSLFFNIIVDGHWGITMLCRLYFLLIQSMPSLSQHILHLRKQSGGASSSSCSSRKLKNSCDCSLFDFLNFSFVLQSLPLIFGGIQKRFCITFSY